MFKGSKIKRFSIILAIVMVASFAIAGLIFVNEYGRNGFTNLEDKVRPGNAINVNEEKMDSLSGINTIKIKTYSDDIKLVPTDGNEIKAHFYGYYSSSDKDYKPEFKVTTLGNEITVKIEYKDHFGPLMYSSNLKLDVYLPRTYSGTLQINTSSAEVDIDELRLESFICKTSSGDIKAKLVNSKEAEISTTSGSTQISGLYESFSFSSTSGDFNTDSITAQKAVLKTASGQIKGSISADDLQMQSTSGDLFADPVKAKNTKITTASGRAILRGTPGTVEATSTSGDIRIEYNEYGNDITIKTASGKTDIKLPGNAEFTLNFRTASGDAKCDFPITISGDQGQRNLLGTVVSDKNKISITSSSGDLNITK